MDDAKYVTNQSADDWAYADAYQGNAATVLSLLNEPWCCAAFDRARERYLAASFAVGHPSEVRDWMLDGVFHTFLEELETEARANARLLSASPKD